jgi:tetratricopeptide (TPR) repeat protein
MKRILFLLLMLGSAAAFAQKQAKPNINKALTAWKEGKFDEAKQIIDAATTYEKTMNDGKTWYYRGLIYASLDTTSNEQYKALEPNPLKVSMESFNKAKQMGKEGTEYFVQGADLLPVTQTIQLEGFANHYLNKGLRAFQEDGDNAQSLAYLNKTKTIFESGILSPYRNDTLTYYVEAIVAQQSDSLDLAIESANNYLEKGGTSKDIYNILYQIYYSGPKEDKNKALEVVRKGRAAFPANAEFPKMEIGLLIDMGKIEEAKAGLIEAIKKEPGNKILHFYLGYAYTKTDNTAEARKAFEEALKVDPAYWEAQFYLANTYLVDVDKTSKELSNVPNTPAYSKKRSELVQKRVRESETALTYLEKAENMKAPDKESEIELLQKLGQLYYYTADDKNSARVQKKLKALGVTEE